MANEKVFRLKIPGGKANVATQALPLNTETVVSVVAADDIAIIIGSSIRSDSMAIATAIQRIIETMRERNYLV